MGTPNYIQPGYMLNPEFEDTPWGRLKSAWGIGPSQIIADPNYQQPAYNPVAEQQRLNGVFRATPAPQPTPSDTADVVGYDNTSLDPNSLAAQYYAGRAIPEYDPYAEVVNPTEQAVAQQVTQYQQQQQQPVAAATRPRPQPRPQPRPRPRQEMYNGVPIHRTAAAAKAGQYVRIGNEVYYKRPEGGYVLVSRG